MNDNYAHAKSSIRQKIDSAIIHKNGDKIGYYNGTIDITQGINFHWISESYSLTQKQYESLINYAQKYAEKEVNLKW